MSVYQRVAKVVILSVRMLGNCSEMRRTCTIEKLCVFFCCLVQLIPMDPWPLSEKVLKPS